MTAQEIEAHFITVPGIMADSGQDKVTVHNWLKYHRYVPFQHVLGRPVVKREDYEVFKTEHPEFFVNAEETKF